MRRLPERPFNARTDNLQVAEVWAGGRGLNEVDAAA
jgi:hypothetical protein